MVDVMPAVKKALETVIKAFYFYPETFKELPCASYYEANNATNASADDTEYSSEVVYIVDIWGETAGQVAGAASGVNEQMVSLGFIREYARDVHDPSSTVRHKTMRFKLITGDDDIE